MRTLIAAWMPGYWVAAGALDQALLEDAVYAAAIADGLVADDVIASAGPPSAAG
jgi:hypothetical protein